MRLGACSNSFTLLSEKVRVDVERCVRCGFCNSTCPTSQITYFESHKARGRMIILQAVFEGVTNISLGNYQQLASLCLNCKRCATICPARIPIPQIMIRIREAYIRGNPFLNNLNSLTTNVPLFCKIGSTLQLLPLGKNIVSLLQQVGGFDKRRTLRLFYPDQLPTFTRELGSKAKRRVVFFAGCHARWIEPYVGQSTADLLAALGVEVIAPRTECCGLPSLTSGDTLKATKVMETNAAILIKYVRRGFDIVSSCPTCSLVLKQEAKEYCSSKDVSLVADHTYDLGEYIRDTLLDKLCTKGFSSRDSKIAYHQPCHLRAQNIGSPFSEVMRNALNLEVSELENCCGMAGLFGRKREHIDISLKIGSPLFKHILRIRPSKVLSDCPACREQITYATGIKTTHPAVLVKDALFRPKVSD